MMWLLTDTEDGEEFLINNLMTTIRSPDHLPLSANRLGSVSSPTLQLRHSSKDLGVSWHGQRGLTVQGTEGKDSGT